MPVQHPATRSGVYSLARSCKLLCAHGVLIDVGAVFEAFGEDDMHHAKRERGVGPGMNGDVPVGELRGAESVGDR